jgi:hypothetical protein
MKQRTIFVVDAPDEFRMFDESGLSAMLKQMEMKEEDIPDVFGGNAYWLRLTLNDCTFSDQQEAHREAGTDNTLLPQKRFIRAVSAWEKQYADKDERRLLEVSEREFLKLSPIDLANLVDDMILQSWYPSARRDSDFFTRLKEKRANSEKAKS